MNTRGQLSYMEYSNLPNLNIKKFVENTTQPHEVLSNAFLTLAVRVNQTDRQLSAEELSYVSHAFQPIMPTLVHSIFNKISSVELAQLHKLTENMCNESFYVEYDALDTTYDRLLSLINKLSEFLNVDLFENFMLNPRETITEMFKQIIQTRNKLKQEKMSEIPWYKRIGKDTTPIETRGVGAFDRYFNERILHTYIQNKTGIEETVIWFLMALDEPFNCFLNNVDCQNPDILKKSFTEKITQLMSLEVDQLKNITDVFAAYSTHIKHAFVDNLARSGVFHKTINIRAVLQSCCAGLQALSRYFEKLEKAKLQNDTSEITIDLADTASIINMSHNLFRIGTALMEYVFRNIQSILKTAIVMIQYERLLELDADQCITHVLHILFSNNMDAIALALAEQTMTTEKSDTAALELRNMVNSVRHKAIYQKLIIDQLIKYVEATDPQAFEIFKTHVTESRVKNILYNHIQLVTNESFKARISLPYLKKLWDRIRASSYSSTARLLKIASLNALIVGTVLSIFVAVGLLASSSIAMAIGVITGKTISEVSNVTTKYTPQTLESLDKTPIGDTSTSSITP